VTYSLACTGQGGNASKSASVQASPGTLSITSGNPPSGTVGAAYGPFALTASGGVGPYFFSWAAASGSTLPPGLSLTNGIISGTPSAEGTYNLVVTVTDSESPAVQKSQAYTITIVKTEQLAITSGLPPDGVAGNVYDPSPNRCINSKGMFVVCGGFVLNATGGIPPYKWSWAGASGSSTPPGLHVAFFDALCSPVLSANKKYWRICGTPTTAGTYPVVVTLADSASPANQASANYTINIVNPPPPAISLSKVAEGAINLLYSFTFTATDGLSPLSWSEKGALPSGLALAADGTLSGTPTVTGSFPITMMVSDSLGRGATPQDFTLVIATHGFKITGSIGIDVSSHTATLLQDGKVLVAGGQYNVLYNGYYHVQESSSAEVYDPSISSFTQINSMVSIRSNHRATLLKDGTVLMTGGTVTDDLSIAPTAELYNPSSGSFASTGNMETTRALHTATLLQDGRVLLTGGLQYGGATLASAEIFDPKTHTFSPTGSMKTARSSHTATLLSSGKVLVMGGADNSGNALASAELFDPSKGTFSSVGGMAVARYAHTATMLNTGKVLITGGADSTRSATAKAELYDPLTGQAALTSSMADAREFHTSTLLNDGTVLVAGGAGRSAEIFDPLVQNFSETGSMNYGRALHTATLLNDGTILVTGGGSGTAEIYQ